MKYVLMDVTGDDGHTEMHLYTQSQREIGVLGRFVQAREYRTPAERETAERELRRICGDNPVIERP